MSARPLTELKGGSLNRIFSDGHTVIKLYFGNDRRGVEKLVREINFLQSLPVELKKYFPNILYSGKEADGAWYAMPHYNMITITKHILSENLNANDAWAAIKNVLKFMTNKVYVCNVTRHIPKTYVAKTQFCRVMESLKILKNLKPFSKLVEQNYIFLNDQKLTGPDKVIKVLRRDQNILQLLLPDRLSLFHGNLHPDNILVNPTKLTDFVLLDPRGELLGTKDYDDAKMFKSLHSRYDEIHYGSFKFGAAQNKFKLTFTNGRTGRIYARILRRFLQYKFNAEKDPDKWLKKMLLIEAFHTLSLTSYHARKQSYDAARVMAYYTIGLKLLNDAIDGTSIANRPLFL